MKRQVAIGTVKKEAAKVIVLDNRIAVLKSKMTRFQVLFQYG